MSKRTNDETEVLPAEIYTHKVFPLLDELSRMKLYALLPLLNVHGTSDLYLREVDQLFTECDNAKVGHFSIPRECPKCIVERIEMVTWQENEDSVRRQFPSSGTITSNARIRDMRIHYESLFTAGHSLDLSELRSINMYDHWNEWWNVYDLLSIRLPPKVKIVNLGLIIRDRNVFRNVRDLNLVKSYFGDDTFIVPNSVKLLTLDIHGKVDLSELTNMSHLEVIDARIVKYPDDLFTCKTLQYSQLIFSADNMPLPGTASPFREKCTINLKRHTTRQKIYLPASLWMNAFKKTKRLIINDPRLITGNVDCRNVTVQFVTFPDALCANNAWFWRQLSSVHTLTLLIKRHISVDMGILRNVHTLRLDLAYDFDDRFIDKLSDLRCHTVNLLCFFRFMLDVESPLLALVRGDIDCGPFKIILSGPCRPSVPEIRWGPHQQFSREYM